MTDYGIVLANEGSPMDEEDYKYDSRRATLILDLEADPKHMQIVEHIGGTAATDSGAAGRLKYETLFEMRHNLGFTPLVDAYFFAKTFDGSETDVNAGGYGGEIFFMSGGVGTVADVVTFEVDDKNFRIVHIFDAYFGGTGFVSLAPRYGFRTKFYIYSIDIGRSFHSGYMYDSTGTIIP